MLLVSAGFLAGAVNAVAGGGTLLTFPALLATGLSPVAANVTNTVAVWPGYLSGAATYRHNVRQRRDLLVPLGVVSIIGAVLGTVALLTAPDSVFRALVPFLVLGATAVIALQPRISAWLTARRPVTVPVGGRVVGDGGDGGVSRHRVGLLAATFAGAVYGAYFGGGLGIVLLAVLALGTGENLGQVNGVKTMLSLLINTVALVGFALYGPVDWWSALLVAPASLLGGVVGGRAAQRLRPGPLRVAVVIFGTAVGVYLLIR
ncbi:sulfite exporter TauE/SafE family protein [Luedemannella flava]|uniref:Probable membrane transporter protein n=1 Tax=Luedemannella flava TaxID=349316 RepID=A0ABP4Y5J2_9ACTN